MAEEVRIDKYLWAIRAFKTRSEAADACKGNRVKVNDADAKPSKMIRIGDRIEVRKAAIHYTYRVTGLIENREVHSSYLSMLRILRHSLNWINSRRLSRRFSSSVTVAPDVLPRRIAELSKPCGARSTTMRMFLMILMNNYQDFSKHEKISW